MAGLIDAGKAVVGRVKNAVGNVIRFPGKALDEGVVNATLSQVQTAKSTVRGTLDDVATGVSTVGEGIK